MKCKALLIAIICYLTLLSGVCTAFAAANVNVSTNSTNVTISGNTSKGNSEVTMVVKRNTDNARQYIDQIKSDSNGQFSVSFILPVGEYTAQIKAQGEEFVKSITVNEQNGTSSSSGGSSGSGNQNNNSQQNQQPSQQQQVQQPEQQQPQETINKDTFSDIKTHWARNDIEVMAAKGIVKGMSNNTFEPNAKVTRAQFVTFLNRALGILSTAFNSSFTDVLESNWFAGDAQAASEAGLVKGFDGEFRPNDPISRQEMAVMLVRAVEYKKGAGLSSSNQKSVFIDENSISSWALNPVMQAYEQGLLKGRSDKSFSPQDTTTRAEAVVAIMRMMEITEVIL